MSKLNYTQLATEIHENSLKHGWWESNPSAEHFLTLVVCELAEAVEADRKNKRAKRPNPIPAGTWRSHQVFDIAYAHFKDTFNACIKDTVEDELADAAIRILDMAGAYKCDMSRACLVFVVSSHNSFTENVYAIVKELVTYKYSLEEKLNYALLQIQELSRLMGIDLEWHIRQKMLYNASRPYKHGKAY